MRVYLLFLVGYGGYALQTRAPIQAMTISGTPPRWSHPSTLGTSHPPPQMHELFVSNFPYEWKSIYTLATCGHTLLWCRSNLSVHKSDRLGTARGFTVHDNACLECSRIIYIICVYIYIENPCYLNPQLEDIFNYHSQCWSHRTYAELVQQAQELLSIIWQQE